MFGALDALRALLTRRASPPRPWRSLAPNVLLAVGSFALVIVAMVGAELLLRWWSPGYLIQARGIHVFSTAYGWAGRPGALAPMGGGQVSLNARGYRGRALPLPKTGPRTRVVVLGDSIAFGYGVSDEQTFPHLLEAGDHGLEVANLGMEGYGPGQELLVLKREGVGLDPDLVILAVCLRNDFVDAVLPVALYDGVTPRPRFRLVGDELVFEDAALHRSSPSRALRWLGDHSHLFNRVSALVPRPAVPEDVGWRHRKRDVLRDEDYAFRLTFALVMEMERICREQGIRFLVATFPNGLGYGIRPQLAERFHRSLQAEGVAVVDLGARFKAMGLTPAALAIDSTGHLGPRGHVLSSEILVGEIGSRFGLGRGPVD